MIKGGRSRRDKPILRRDDPIPSRTITGRLLKAAASGRNAIADNFFDAATALAKFATDSLNNAFLLKAFVNGAFQADAATRALFADGFLTKTKLASGFVGYGLIAGGAAGDHTLTGVALGDRLILVCEQDGASGILTDRTSEFSITATDTINNGGGTDTTADLLVILYEDLT